MHVVRRWAAGIAALFLSGLVVPGSAAAQTYYGGYHTAADMLRHAQTVGGTYPGIAAVYDIGASWLATQGYGGHRLQAICLTGIAPASMPVKAVAKAGFGLVRPDGCALSTVSNKPKLLLFAQIHAREIATGELMWRWIDYLADGYGVDPEATSILDSTEVWIVPVANPDGVDIVSATEGGPLSQRKNVDDAEPTCAVADSHGGNGRGVDLERNFSGRWGEAGADADPCAQDYRGAAAASEPETRALEGLVSAIFADQRGEPGRGEVPDSATGLLIDLHSFGNYVITPSVTAPEDAAQLRNLAAAVAPAGFASGTSMDTVGYPTSGTSMDYAYGALGVAALAMEIGPREADCAGFFPEYSCLDRLLWPQIRQAFTAAVRAAAAPYRQ
ncbi:M14 family zinc carboxypeptidase [Nocardia sp. CA-107356]|uniref:M14 family zinc carboxypeptidase n=1 Tax=Nocardia sp. CA-107356 TaxID=3239972 RepID=UPI003D8F8D0A